MPKPPETGRSLGGSKSAPLLAAAYNLRQYSLGKKLLVMEVTRSPPELTGDTLKDRARRKVQADRRAVWKQMEIDEKGEEAAERERLRKIKEKADKRRRKELEEQHERQLIEESERFKKDKEEFERLQREKMWLARKEEEERQRLRAEEAERDRIRRLPTQCNTCSGTGKCPMCFGEKVHYSTYLTSNVGPGDMLEFGKKPQGCEACMGFSPGILGEISVGTGHCFACGGLGKFWPVLDDPKDARAYLERASSPMIKGVSEL